MTILLHALAALVFGDFRLATFFQRSHASRFVLAGAMQALLSANCNSLLSGYPCAVILSASERPH
jgi:hypothetical protein